MNIISKMTINGKTQINGRYINQTGQSVSITDNGIYVNGKPIEQFDESQVPVLKIEITGNVESKNGNVMCGKITGDCDTKNGNIMRGY